MSVLLDSTISNFTSPISKRQDMIELNLLNLREHLQFRQEKGKRYVFDLVRRKWLVSGPEELVRQLLVYYLLLEKGYSKGRIGIEKGLVINGLERRCDVLIYDSFFSPFLLIECKAPKVKIDDAVFRQIAQYNMPLQVPYLMVTNGIVTYCCAMDYQKHSYEFLDELPEQV